MSRRTRNLALLGIALLGAACSTDRAPTAAPSVEPSANRTTTQITTVSRELLSQQQAELQRISLEAQRSVRTLDSLRKVFAAGKKEHKQGSPILVCTPMKYDAAVRIVGAEGGELRVGPHTLSIPAGALRKPTVITAEAPVSLARELRFSPHGTRFEVAPTVTIQYAGCAVPSGHVSTLAYVNDRLDVLEWPRARDDGRQGQVIGQIWHFSTYALSARRSSYATSW